MIKQISKKQIVINTITDKETRQRYINIDSEEGQALILEHNLVINPEIEEF